MLAIQSSLSLGAWWFSRSDLLVPDAPLLFLLLLLLYACRNFGLSVTSRRRPIGYLSLTSQNIAKQVSWFISFAQLPYNLAHGVKAIL